MTCLRGELKQELSGLAKLAMDGICPQMAINSRKHYDKPLDTSK